MIQVFQTFAILLTLSPLLGCSGVFYQPDQRIYFPPEKNNFLHKSLFFDSKDGTRLSAWWFPPQRSGKALTQGPKGTIVQFHGNAQNISSHYASLIWLPHEGYNLFTVDYRGYGMSEGSPNQKGVHEDALAALTQAYKLHKESKAQTFVVYGQSLGGAISLRALADFQEREQVDLVVMDSTFDSYQRVARRKLQSNWITWLFAPLAYLLVSDEYAPEDTLDQMDNRLLVVHAKEDPIVGFENGQDIYDSYPGPKELWTLDTPSHIATFW